MDMLSELSTISDYRPERGVLLDMYKLLVERNIERKEVVQTLQKEGIQNFNISYKRLKDRMLGRILHQSFSGLTKVQKLHIETYKNYVQAKTLIHLDKRISGTKIAEETIRKAEKIGLIEIALSLSINLEIQFSTFETNNKKYLYYANKSTKLKQTFDEIYEMQKIYTVFLYKQRNGKCVDEIIEQLEKMKVVAQTNDNFAFQLCYFHCINRYADIKNDMNLFLSNTNKALAFFNSSKTPLPYTTKWLFLINLVPIYINRKEYTRAEQSLSACLELPKKGTFNWHLTLIYKALYGFRTNKPAIALNAWQTAHSTSFKFKSSLIEDQWKIIEAYLALFRNNGRIHYNDKFSIYKLNTTKASKDNKDRKANLLVLELLHLLSTQKLKSFTKKTWEIEGIIKREFNTQKYRRTKYFLRSIRAIVDGNITPTGAARHAVIPLEKMRAISSPLNSNNVESEIVPYEILWDLVMDTLRRGG